MMSHPTAFIICFITREKQFLFSCVLKRRICTMITEAYAFLRTSRRKRLGDDNCGMNARKLWILARDQWILPCVRVIVVYHLLGNVLWSFLHKKIPKNYISRYNHRDSFINLFGVLLRTQEYFTNMTVTSIIVRGIRAVPLVKRTTARGFLKDSHLCKKSSTLLC